MGEIFKRQPRISDAWEFIYGSLFEIKFNPENEIFLDTCTKYDVNTADKQFSVTLVLYKESWKTIEEQSPNLRNVYITILDRTGEIVSVVNVHDLEYKGYRISGDYSGQDLMMIDLLFSFDSSNIDWK